MCYILYIHKTIHRMKLQMVVHVTWKAKVKPICSCAQTSTCTPGVIFLQGLNQATRSGFMSNSCASNELLQYTVYTKSSNTSWFMSDPLIGSTSSAPHPWQLHLDMDQPSDHGLDGTMCWLIKQSVDNTICCINLVAESSAKNGCKLLAAHGESTEWLWFWRYELLNMNPIVIWARTVWTSHQASINHNNCDELLCSAWLEFRLLLVFVAQDQIHGSLIRILPGGDCAKLSLVGAPWPLWWPRQWLVSWLLLWRRGMWAVSPNHWVSRLSFGFGSGL